MNPLQRSQAFRLRLTLALTLVCGAVLLFALWQAAHAATLLIVNTSVDESDGSCSDGDCSLRDALALAANGDTITFADSYTIILASQLEISKPVTLERRRQIGIMKAMGLQTENVLGLLLLENGLVGLGGGLLGAGLSILTLLGTQALGDVSAQNTPYAALGLLVLLAVGLSLAATLITAWGAARERPLNVLRYE